MSREFKPGDVARIEYGGFDDIAVRIDPKDWAVPAGTVRDANVTDVRPLVVIDPEDREAVERLWLGWKAAGAYRARGTEPEACDSMQAALREYANPKPPKCGAVLSLAGLSYRCELDGDHDEPHSNDTARALWGERE